MNYFLIGCFALFVVLDGILVKRYETKIKNLVDENRELKKDVSSIMEEK